MALFDKEEFPTHEAVDVKIKRIEEDRNKSQDPSDKLKLKLTIRGLKEIKYEKFGQFTVSKYHESIEDVEFDFKMLQKYLKQADKVDLLPESPTMKGLNKDVERLKKIAKTRFNKKL